MALLLLNQGPEPIQAQVDSLFVYPIFIPLSKQPVWFTCLVENIAFFSEPLDHDHFCLMEQYPVVRVIPEISISWGLPI